MAVKTAIELKAYFETGDVPTQAQFVDLIDTIFSAVPSYKVYTALLTQTGTNAPVATVLENTLGSITYIYNSDGYYSIISDNLFTNKTFLTITNITDIGDYTGLNACNIVKIDNSTFDIKTISSSNVIANECLLNSPIEIRVYN